MNPGSCPIATCPISGNGDSTTIRQLAIGVGPFDVTNKYIVGSLAILGEINSRGEADFEISDTAPPTITSKIGAPVRVVADGSTIFAGTIEELSRKQLGNSKKTNIRYRCVDFNQLADRKIVNNIFTATTAGAIVTTLLDDHLAADGVIAGAIEAGPTIDRFVVKYKKLSSVLDELGELAGGALFWSIDTGKRLNFVSRATVVAPWQIDSISNPTMDMVVRDSRQSLRNRQIVRAGQDRTAVQVETFKGDGESRTFNTRFKVGEKPSKIETNLASAGFTTIADVDVGINGLDESKKWYFKKSDRGISQGSSEVVLTSSDVLRITYIGLFRAVSIRQDNGSIDERKAIEGGSGIYEDVQSEPNIESSAFATIRADGFLERFGSIGKVVSYQADKVGLLPGQLQNITDSDLDVNAQFLLVSVSVRDRGDLYQEVEGSGLRFTVQASSAGRFQSWIEFFRLLIAAGNRQIIDEDEILDLTVNQVDVVDVDDALVADQTDNIDLYTVDPHSVFIVGEGVIGKSLVGDPEKS